MGGSEARLELNVWTQGVWQLKYRFQRKGKEKVQEKLPLCKSAEASKGHRGETAEIVRRIKKKNSGLTSGGGFPRDGSRKFGYFSCKRRRRNAKRWPGGRGGSKNRLDGGWPLWWRGLVGWEKSKTDALW